MVRATYIQDREISGNVYIKYTKSLDFYKKVCYNTTVDRRSARRHPASCKFTKKVGYP